MKVDAVINFFNIDEIVIAKIMGRRVCPDCNKNFNVTDIDFSGYRMPPLLPSHGDPEFCDNADHAEPVRLVQREDDREDIVRERLKIYKEETLPILDFYKSRDDTVIVDFETKKGKADYPIVQQILLEAFGEDMLRSRSDSDGLSKVLSGADAVDRKSASAV